jgi:hypothetical protein
MWDWLQDPRSPKSETSGALRLFPARLKGCNAIKE